VKTASVGKSSTPNTFVSDVQLAHFRAKLLSWREDILSETADTLRRLQEDHKHPDVTDRASSTAERSLELRALERRRLLVAEIDAALKRIDAGTYGYCQETGEPIGLQRLEARPIATLSVEAQERREGRQRLFCPG
jgi:DnaK suppressor protein